VRLYNHGATLIGFTLTNGSVRATTYEIGRSGRGRLLRIHQRRPFELRYHINCAAYAAGGAWAGLLPLSHHQLPGPYRRGWRGSGKLDRCEVIWNTTDNNAGGLYYCQATTAT